MRTRAGQEVIKPGDVRVIGEEGMPQHKNPFVKGNMYATHQTPKFTTKFALCHTPQVHPF